MQNLQVTHSAHSFLTLYRNTEGMKGRNATQWSHCGGWLCQPPDMKPTEAVKITIHFETSNLHFFPGCFITMQSFSTISYKSYSCSGFNANLPQACYLPFSQPKTLMASSLVACCSTTDGTSLSLCRHRNLDYTGNCLVLLTMQNSVALFCMLQSRM